MIALLMGFATISWESSVLTGHARVSTPGQGLDLQEDASKEAGWSESLLT